MAKYSICINLDWIDDAEQWLIDFYYSRTGRVFGCQSKNHTICKGELWTCERCGIRVCWEEGSTDMPELCDNCWAEAKKRVQSGEET